MNGKRLQKGLIYYKQYYFINIVVKYEELANHNNKLNVSTTYLYTFDT